MIILGIETSCDETAVSILEVKNSKFKILSNIVSSQVSIHARWGGVVPNLAAREHLINIFPIIETCLKEAEIKPEEIDLLTVTNGPGLIPALLIGANVAKTLSFVWKKPLLGIHHIEGHIYANFLKNEKVAFPALCLVVSGGHTQLILMKKNLSYEIIGQTLDDAAGEAFDKVARILNLGYPGGPAIAKTAKIKPLTTKSKRRESPFKLPRPMLISKNFNFSFSGLKTAVLYTVKKNPAILKSDRLIAELCAEFQQSIVDVLLHKTVLATQKYRPKTLMLAGGVSANHELRQKIGQAIAKKIDSTKYIIPDFAFSVDNATMIAVAGFFRWQKMNSRQKKSAQSNWKNLKTEANLILK